MAGWSKGYVIPRLANLSDTPPLVRGVPCGMGEAKHGHGAHAESHISGDNGNGCLRHLRNKYKLIFSSRCIYCKSFHDPNKYCFRFTTFEAMARGRGRRITESDSDSSSSSETGGENYEEGSSIGDPSDSEDSRTIVQDNLGPPFGQDLSAFYKSRK